MLSEVGAAPWHMPTNAGAFSLTGKLRLNSVCPARPFIKFGNPGVRSGLGQQRRAEFPKGKGVARSITACSCVVSDSVLERKLKKGVGNDVLVTGKGVCSLVVGCMSWESWRNVIMEYPGLQE